MRHSFIFQNIFLVFSERFVYKNYIKYRTQKFTGNSMQACASESHDTQEQLSDKDREFMHQAYELALKGYNEGGCPIGAVLVDEDGTVLGAGHNALVQEGNPIIHGEMAAMRDAGRLDSRRKTTMYTSLSPCMMCAGTIVQFKIGRVVVGDVVNSPGNVEFLREKGVKVDILNYEPCIDLVKKFREEKPELWLEDWGGA